jgi:peptidoglycan/xylan/chitin deacetylase (PgdA/CDA1 family)
MSSGARVVNFTFHGVGVPGRAIPREEVPAWITIESFHAILDAVGGKADVTLSFDDGNASDVQVALPALVSRGLRAAFFVLAGRLREPGSLGAADLRTLRGAGMTVGLHGEAHVPWRKLSDQQLGVELVDARRRIEDALGEPVSWAACPFGSYGRRVLARLREEGFERVFTSDRGPARADAWLQPRNTITNCDTADDAIRIWRSPGNGIVRRLKMALKRIR